MIKTWNWFWFEDNDEGSSKNQFTWITFRFMFFMLLALDIYVIMNFATFLFDPSNRFYISKIGILYEYNPIHPFIVSGQMLYELYFISFLCFISSAFGIAYTFSVTCGALAYSTAYFSTLLDSFQHHYLLCLILFILIFKEEGGELIPRLLSIQLSIVYLFGVMTKLTDGFLFIKGSFTPNVAMVMRVHRLVTWITKTIGIIQESHVWSGIALITIFCEVFLALSIVVAVRYRNKDTIRFRLFGFVVWIVGTCLHISFEVFGSLSIRFFSWYMMILYWGLIGPNFFVPKFQKFFLKIRRYFNGGMSS